MFLLSRHGQKLKTLAISCVSDFTQTHVTAYINLVEPRLTTTPFIRPPRYYSHILSNQT